MCKHTHQTIVNSVARSSIRIFSRSNAFDNLLPSSFSSANYVAGSPVFYYGVRVGCLCVISKASRAASLNLNASLQHHARKLEDRMMPPVPDQLQGCSVRSNSQTDEAKRDSEIASAGSSNQYDAEVYAASDPLKDLLSPEAMAALEAITWDTREVTFHATRGL